MLASPKTCTKQGKKDGRSNNETIDRPADWGHTTIERGTAIQNDTTRVATDKLSIDIEDEISWVLHEFRLQGSPIHSIELCKGVNRTKKRPFPGYFSDVTYHSTSSGVGGDTMKGQRSNDRYQPMIFRSGPYIEVSYLLEKVLSLKFQVYIQALDNREEVGNDCESNKDSYTTFVVYSDDNTVEGSVCRPLARGKWEILTRNLRSICETLNGNNLGLFAVLSKLLLSLNLLQTKVLNLMNNAYNEKDNLLSPLTDREKNNCLERLLEKGGSSCSGGVDLAILLLRCAAMGKHAELFAHPFPRTGHPIAESIWNITERHQRFQRRRFRKSKANPRSSMVFHPSEHQHLGFLCSLPWMKQGRITVTRRSLKKGEARTFDLCLHLNDNKGSENDALHSPRFARSCHRHGGITVFHGTCMENVWSILHNGFFNPSKVGRGGNEFVKNGAMLGSGVYLTTSRKVATFFATSNASARTVRNALNHDSLKNLLSMASSGETLLWGEGKIQDGDDRISTFLDELFNVSCFPVFEAKIIRPPCSDDRSIEPISQIKKRNSSVGNGTTITRHDGKYYVVPDGREIRITKLHLTFELTQRKRETPNFVLKEYFANSTRPLIALAIWGLIVAFVLGILRV